ncbi:MAG: hypothetical protein H7A18_10805 [Sinobacteraceae bacterium]|nr:hypothetical protein [Nevskiaceae bacterium]MCP5338928.1 hypothetical protein [Nevskiaceae bacterium]MCP5359659.1 hypothetical protein [Nevskiaceae bacterium]MCP5472547.1 hypothetical protein [Nevskiaceae bacterium]
MTTVALAALVLASSATLFAGPREQAKRIHDRIAGVPPSAQVLDQMEADVAAGRPLDAANRALESSAFYNVTLKNFAAPWTNREQSVFVPLNDYMATVIGMVRDDEPFNTVLSADILYTGQGVAGVPAYSPSSNAHYEQLEQRGADLKAVLVKQQQSALAGLPATATAGVVTSRAAAEAFFVAGTNRAMLRFTLMNHMCRDLEQLTDTTLPSDRIRQDVSRSPGGDARIFLNNCIGCHTGMEPLAQAYAYYDYDEQQTRLVYTAGRVQPKYFNNADNFKPGYVTPDDRWDNYWRAGNNQLLGWDPALPGSGNGAKSMGQELGNSDAFAQCQVEKVFKAVCFRAPSNAGDRARVQTIKTAFKASNYSLKRVFAETAVYCMGD